MSTKPNPNFYFIRYRLKSLLEYENSFLFDNISFYFFSIIKSIPELTISRLLVSSADQSDAGNYACSSEAGYSNTTAIHVITGKKMMII